MNLVIIAAGQGSRIRTNNSEIPKGLLKVNGKPILQYLLENGNKIGVEKFVIVTGYQSEKIAVYTQNSEFSNKVKTIVNPKWQLANGLSVLEAKKLIPANEPFLLTMSDHLYDSNLLSIIAKSSMNSSVVNVGVDYRINSIFDIEDGMKVQIPNRRSEKISEMSKNLTKYNAVDCGVFKCDYSFFDVLEEAGSKGHYSISDACYLLINRGEICGIDIQKNSWFDVDTPEAFEHCKNNFHSLDF